MRPTRGCVFVVDDEEAIRRSLCMLLQAEGLVVRAFASAAEAIAAFDDVRPACILTDYHMPDMSGMDLVREIRRRDPGMPLVVMTGTDDPGQLRLDAHVRLVEKPFDATALARLLTSLMDERGG